MVNSVAAIADYTGKYHGVDGVDQLTAGEYSIEGRGSGQRIVKWSVRMYYWFENLFSQMAYNIHSYHSKIGKLTRLRLQHGEFNRLLGAAFLNNETYAAERVAKRRRIHALVPAANLPQFASPMSSGAVSAITNLLAVNLRFNMKALTNELFAAIA
jgi:hypothetical protein